MARSGSYRRLAAYGGLLVVLVLGCGGDKGTKPKDGGSQTPITMPLKVGNRWTYAVTTIEGQTSDTTSAIEQVTGTRVLGDGQTYWIMETQNPGFAPDTTYIRQSGQEVYVYQIFPIGGDLASRWMLRKLAASLPWKLADFTAQSGQIFSFEAETTLVDSGVTLRLTLNGASLGRTQVEVPGGSYTDVYEGRLTVLETVFSGGIAVVNGSVMDDIYVKDAIGVVRQDEESRYELYGEDPQITTTRSLLRSYSFP